MANDTKPRRRRRTRTMHVGVKIRRRTRTDNGQEIWLARWRDPETGQQRECSLDKLGLTSAEARREWVIRKSDEIAARAAEIRAGAPVLTSTDVATVARQYLERSALELRPGTLATYSSNVKKFVAWAGQAGVRTIESVTPAALAKFRLWLAQQPAARPAKASPRGAKHEAGRPRATTLNADLAGCSAMLNDLRRLGLLPRCTSDHIRDALRRFPAERTRPPFLRPTEIRTLLEAALRHDRATFMLTRDEKEAGRQVGDSSTLRYRPIAPLLLFSLLAGTRLNEAVSLRWEHVHLDAFDGQGEVIISAAISKTRTERSIPLNVSPSLRTMLATMQPQAAGSPTVFGLTFDDARNAMKRLVRDFGAPAGTTWKSTRSTTGTYLTNAPGIYGAASAFHSARRLGHSVAIAEKHYLGVVHVPAEARTLEEAMGIAELTRDIILRGEGRAPAGRHAS